MRMILGNGLLIGGLAVGLLIGGVAGVVVALFAVVSSVAILYDRSLV